MNKTGATDMSMVYIILIIIFLAVITGSFLQKSYGIFAITGQETMVRNLPESVKPGSSFEVIYQVLGVSEKYGASIIDSVSGGCQFPAGTTLKSVMLSTEGTTKTIKVTAPSSGTCTFSGDYKFGTEAIKNFPDGSVVITSSAPETPETPTIPEEELPPPSTTPFDINMVLFNIGDLKVTLIMFIGGLILLAILFKIIGGRR